MTATRTRLARQLGASLRLTADVVARVHHGERGASGDPGAPLLVPTKVYGEAALLLRASGGVTGDDDLTPARSALHDSLVAALADADGLWQAVLAPADRIDHLFPLLLVPGPWSTPARALTVAAEPPPWAGVPERLERAWLHAVAGDAPAAPPHLADLVAASHLVGEVDLLHGDLADAYAFTHAVLHATDQGRWRLPLGTAVLGRARSLLATALLADNDDVAAELLWTWPLLGVAPDPATAGVLALLADRAERWGFLPGPTWDEPRDAAAAADPGRDGMLYRHQTSYHTTLAWGLACAATLRRETVATPSQPGWPDPSGLLAELPGRWAAATAASPPSQRRAAAPLALAAALRHAAATGDLATVPALLRWAVAAGLDAEPAVTQAARWLSSISDLARATAPADLLVNSP